MKIKIELFTPERIIYVVIYRHRIPKKVEINNRYYKCVDKVYIIKSSAVGDGIRFSNYYIKNWKWDINDYIRMSK